MKFIYSLTFLILFQFHAFAIEGTPILQVKKVKEKNISFSISNQKKLSITLCDSQNQTLFSEQINELSSSTFTYNLANYKDGNYYLIVSNEEKSVKHRISVSKNIATLSKQPIMETFLKNLEDLQIVATN